MFCFQKFFIFQSSHLSRKNLLVSYAKMVYASLSNKKDFTRSALRLEKNENSLVLGDYTSVLDVEEERRKVIIDDRDEFEERNFKRGVTGVFDIEEIVEILNKEKAQDIFVVKIPPEYNYADFMVIVSGRSQKHLLAMSEYIRRLYKKKAGKNSKVPVLEGKNSNTWMALDLGNIIFHAFSKDSRKVYDLETLWSVGKEYDSMCQSKKISTVEIMPEYEQILSSLTPNS